MKIAFIRNVQEIELFDRKYKIASLTINDLLALDTINVQGLPEGHITMHKMLLSVFYALAYNYRKFSIFHPYTYYKARKDLSYRHLKAELDVPTLTHLLKIVDKLNSVQGEDDGEKKKTQE